MSNFSKHRKSFEAKHCDQPTSSVMRNETSQPFNSANTHSFKTASDLSSESFSLLHLKRLTNLISTPSVDDFLHWESGDSQSTKTLTSSSQGLKISYDLRSRPIQPLSSFRTRSTSSSISALLRYHVQSQSFSSGKLLSSLSVIQLWLRLRLIKECSSLFTYTLNLFILCRTKNQSLH